MRTISYAAIISTALFAAASGSRADTITMFNVNGTAVNQAFAPLGSCAARAHGESCGLYRGHHYRRGGGDA